MSPLLLSLMALAERLRSGGSRPEAIGTLFRWLVHSPLADMLVSQTATKADDAALAFLRSVLPKPADQKMAQASTGAHEFLTGMPF